MFIGVGRFDLFLPASGSLKDKRQVLRSVTQSIQKRFNVAIAEVDHLDKWQRSALGVSCVAGSIGHCQKVLQEVEKAIGRATLDGAEITGRTIEFVSLDDIT